MGGQALERRVEEAEQATGHVVREQGRRVAEAVPVRIAGEEQRLDSSTRAATDSTRELGRQADRIRRFLGSRRDENPWESRFAQAAQGFAKPGRVFATPEEARVHSGELRSGAEAALGQEALALLSATPDDVSRRDSNQDEANDMNTEVATQWMTRDFLGDTVYERFSAALPVATTETTAWFRTVGEAGLGGHTGYYFPGTNHIVVTMGRSEDSSYSLMAHEQLHYAAYLGGGMGIRWRDDRGGPVMRGQGFWNIHEGLTELHAQQLTRSHGYEPSSVGYPYETAISFVMQQAVGEEPLRRAYLSGDFTEVRTLLDARMGAGTFDSLMSTQVNAEAYSIIMQKASAAGMDVSSWESNPILGQCYRQIAVEMTR